MTTQQAATYFNVSTRTIHRWIRNGKLTGEQVEGRWVIHLDGHGVKDVDDGNVKAKRQHVNHDEHRQTQLEQSHSEISHLTQLLNEKTTQNQHLLDQLVEKDNQLARRDEQMESLTQQIDHLTQIVAMSQKNITTLTEQLDSSRQMIEDMRQRRTAWQRIKAVFVAETG